MNLKTLKLKLLYLICPQRWHEATFPAAFQRRAAVKGGGKAQPCFAPARPNSGFCLHHRPGSDSDLQVPPFFSFGSSAVSDLSPPPPVGTDSIWIVSENKEGCRLFLSRCYGVCTQLHHRDYLQKAKVLLGQALAKALWCFKKNLKFKLIVAPVRVEWHVCKCGPSVWSLNQVPTITAGQGKAYSLLEVVSWLPTFMKPHTQKHKISGGPVCPHKVFNFIQL